MKKNIFTIPIIGILLMIFMSGLTWAGEVDVLINKLVEKGILSGQEATQLLLKTQNEKEREKAVVKEIAKEAAQKETKNSMVEIPKWVEKINLKGDLRFRYQNEDKDDDGAPSRDRWRVRARLGAVVDVTEHWEAGFGLATGGDDPRSTNETLDDTFESPDVRLDYAYLKYSPFKSVALFGGKFKNPLWKTKDLLWDGDIRTDGIAAKLNFKTGPAEIFFTPAYFILDEYKADRDDPYMLAFQGGTKLEFMDNMYFKVAATYYYFGSVRGNDFSEHGSGTNSVDSSGNLTQDYDSIAFDAEYGINLGGPVPCIALFGQYVSSDADEDETGYLAGLKFGHKKVKKFGQWQVKYNYRDIERDAWPDFLPDSDFYGGATDAKGNEIELVFGLAKYVTLGVDYYFNVEPLNDNTDREQDLLQADLVVKW